MVTYIIVLDRIQKKRQKEKNKSYTENRHFKHLPEEENMSQSNPQTNKSPTEFVFLFCPLLVRTQAHLSFPPQWCVFIANPKEFHNL